jgi:hypothetical protein
MDWCGVAERIDDYRDDRSGIYIGGDRIVRTLDGAGVRNVIADVAMHRGVAFCPTAATCTAEVGETSVGSDPYRAYVASVPNTYPEAGTRAASGAVRVGLAPVTLALLVDQPVVSAGKTAHFTVTARRSIGRTPYSIYIVDRFTATIVATRSAGATCEFAAGAPAVGTHAYRAHDARSGTASQASSILLAR